MKPHHDVPAGRHGRNEHGPSGGAGTKKESANMGEGSIDAAFTSKREATEVPKAAHDPHLRANDDHMGKSHLHNAMRHLAHDHAGNEMTPDMKGDLPKHRVDKPGV